MGGLLSLAAFSGKIWEFRRILALIKSPRSAYEMIEKRGEIHEI
jgi:hypothetical protein